MAEPLTFLFKFQDDGSSSSAPVGARSGAAAAAMQPQPNTPQPRRGGASSAFSSGQPPASARRSAAPAQRGAERSTDAGRPGVTTASARRQRGAASEVFDDLLRAVRRIPGPIGRVVGLVNDLAEPFARARRRYHDLLERHGRPPAAAQNAPARGAATAAVPVQRRRHQRRQTAARAMQTGAPVRSSPNQPASGAPPSRPRGGASAAAPNRGPRRPRRHDRQPPPGGNPPRRGLVNPPASPIPSSFSPERQALQKLIDALGPLPASQRELIAALRPLRDLGYRSEELRQGLRDRHARLQAAGQHAARQQPNVAQRQRRRRRMPNTTRHPLAHGAGSAVQAARTTVTAAQGGGAAAAAGTALATRGAAAGAMEGAAGLSMLGGPAGLAIGLAVVASVGAAAQAFDALVSTVQRLDHTFVTMGQRLAPFSGKLSAANAINAAKNTISDITSARALGDKLAKYTQLRGDLGRQMQRLNDKIQGVELDALITGLEALNETIEGATILGNTVSEFIKNFSFPWTTGDLIAQLQVAMQKAVLDAANEALRKQQNVQNMLTLRGMFGADALIIDSLNYGSGQNPKQPPGMRVGPIPPVGIGGI